MAMNEPGERRGRASRHLDAPPSTRYAAPDSGPASPRRASVAGPLLQAGIAAAIGAALLFFVGAIVASTAGLVFVSGVMGAAIGLLLARAAVGADEGSPALARTAVVWLAIAVAAGAIVVADVATWLYARGKGGTLGLLDYLLATFGPFVPGELIVAALGAAWGASSGPIRRS